MKRVQCPAADGTAKLSGTDHGVRKSTPTRDQPVRSENLRGDLREIRRGPNLQTEQKDDAEARNDFW